MEDTSVKDDDYLVRVKAQVMTRDDATGGWVPMGIGGLSIVGLRKLVVCGEDVRHEYLIHGQRISDQSVVLNCVLKKDVQYMKANPTFHHWKTENKKFGLTFQTSADARAFDKGVKRAVENLLEASPDSSTDVPEVGDDEVFMTLDLPLGRKDSSSQSASTASTTTSSPTPQSPALSIQDPFTTQYTHPHANHHHLHRVHYISRQSKSQYGSSSTSPSDKGSSKSSTESSNGGGGGGGVGSGGKEEVWVKADIGGKHGTLGLKDDQGITGRTTTDSEKVEFVDNYSYVQFAKNTAVHEYHYPTLDPINKPPQRRDSISSLKKHNLDVITSQPPLLPTKSKKKWRDRMKKDKKQSRHLLYSQRSRCVYCHEMFVHDENSKGNCEEAPDKVQELIEKVSCVCCAQGMLYHCMADADGDYGHPCVCDTGDEANCKKWTALSILSLFVPCLWCYWPLTACHKCGIVCGCCGGRHKAA